MSDFYIPPLPDNFVDSVMHRIEAECDLSNKQDRDLATRLRNKMTHAKCKKARRQPHQSPIYGVGLDDCRDYDIEVGDLVRWVISYAVFAADDKGNVHPVTPIYEMGIVMEVSAFDPCLFCAFVVNSEFGDGYRLVDVTDCEEFEILNKDLVVLS